MSDRELNASELGTLNYWEDIYDREIENFKDHGDVGEVWFGEHNARKVVRYISEKLDLSPSDKIIDIGCGNGWTLVELAKKGFTDLTGVDYAQKAVDLATAVLRESDITDGSTIKLMACDILDIANTSLPNDFKLVHDKGTYDAISLSPDDPQARRTKYIENVCSILRPDGYLVISSCNWTKDELITHFHNTSAVSPIDGSSTYDLYSNVDWSCTSNLTCSTPLSFCNEENKCQCPSGYVFNAAMTACLEAATAYGDNCTETSQCVAHMSVGGTCTNGSCNCAAGYHYLHGRCNKSSGLGEKCQTDDDCFVNADFEALSCKNESCQCSEGFYQREYRTCRRAGTAIGAECIIDLDCTFDKKARCDKQSGCYVSPKIAPYSNASESSNDLASHSRELRDVDVRLFSKLGCTKDSECTHLGPSVCTGTGRCICKHGYGFDSKKENCIPELGEICRSDDDVAIKYSICRNGRWSCGGARVPSKNNLECLKITRSFNSFCKSDEQCYVFGPDSVCTKQCVCNENSHYVEDEMFCWRNGGIGESCQKDADCYVAEFRSKLTCNEKYECSCPVGTHVNTAKTACIDDNPFIGSSCSADVDCKPLSNVRCFNESCVCSDTYFNLSGVCVAGIDAPCKTSHDCNTKNATCVSEICQCGKGLVSPTPGICIPVAPFGGECQYDVQCSASVADARCFKPEVAESDESMIIGATSRTIGSCKCDAGQHRKYEKCYRTRVLDETCYSRGECYVKSDLDSVHCLKGVCTCEFDARKINSTFCENDASTKLVVLSLLISSLLFAMNFSR